METSGNHSEQMVTSRENIAITHNESERTHKSYSKETANVIKKLPNTSKTTAKTSENHSEHRAINQPKQSKIE